MTAEIALLNRHAVALAADSAVTVRDPASNSVKIFNSVNKLFQLSNTEPVGVMIYGSAEIAGYPWELIVKEYRRYLGQGNFPHIRDYAADFTQWTERLLERKGLEAFHELRFFLTNFSLLYSSIDEALRDREAAGKRFDPVVETELAIRLYKESLDQLKPHPKYKDTCFVETVRKYRKEIYQARRMIIDQHFPFLSRASKKDCWLIAHYVIVKQIPLANFSGIVFAGFGSDELFPAIESYRVDAFLHSRLKLSEDQLSDISHDNGANMIPFAQRDLVDLFMEGADRNFLDFVLTQYEGLLADLPDVIAHSYFRSKKKRSAVSDQLGKTVDHVIRIAKQRVDKIQYERFIRPVVDVIVSLPKDELAQLAESLVQLTALKRKISKNPDTVGGPIDVAIISRGEGFIWIKRKHYFSSELNPRFFARQGYYGGRASDQ